MKRSGKMDAQDTIERALRRGVTVRLAEDQLVAIVAADLYGRDGFEANDPIVAAVKLARRLIAAAKKGAGAK